MKLTRYLLFLTTAIFSFLITSAQDFSNKGKEFWIAYSYHVKMVNGGPLSMTLYITSDVNTTYVVEAFGVATIQSGAITAGQVVSVIIPNTYFINNDGKFTNKAIRVTAANPVVVYSYITSAAVSAATLCLPTNVLGKEYYSSNFTQISNETNSYSYFTIVAVEDSTTVEITPSANTKGGLVAGDKLLVNLNKGEIYQVLGTSSSGNTGVYSGSDLSGSRIRSIATGNGGCKRIAVFSGSGKILISSNGSCTQVTSDNLYQQLYPVGTWGRKYLTVPSYNRPTNIYRITINDPATSVTVNGSLISAGSFTNGRYYQFSNNIPNTIQADKPISVAQYFTTQGCDGNPVPYDPDMIMLNPVEQNIDKVTLVSSNLVATPLSNHQHHIHVVMRNGGTGISSFKLDGTPVATSRWVTHPADPAYSYLYLNNINQGYHRIESDSGFNAIAYGYANAESYGYSAGANVKDLYQFASIINEYATIDFPAACKNSPFKFQMTFPYQPTEIKWQFGNLFPDTTLTAPVFDSTYSINDKQLYRYTLPRLYSLPATGTFPIKIIAQNPTPEGCSGEQEISYDLQVFERPVADFNFTSSGCVSDSVKFMDVSKTSGRTAYKWGWNFGDGSTSTVQNPSYLYTTPGAHTVKFSMITDIGCLSDTVAKTVTLSPAPIAKFGVSSPQCIGKSVTFTDSSTSVNSTITRWIWNFGDGTGTVTATTNAPQTHTYAGTGTFPVTLKVESSTGCQSTVYTMPVTISQIPAASFLFGNNCLPDAMQFTDQSGSNIANRPELTYSWDFGDGGTSTLTSPSHQFASAGPFNVSLTVTNSAGCTNTAIKNVNTIYAQPQAVFTAPAEVCLGTAIDFKEQSTAPNSTITKWQWNFGDGNTSTQQHPTHTYAAAGTYTVTLTATSAIGCVSTVASKNILINALPTANFTVSVPTCVNASITFNDGSIANSGNITEWSWNFGDGNTAVKNSTNPFTYTYTSAGSKTVTLQVKTDKGCSSTILTKPVGIHPLPVPGFIMPGNCLADPFTQFMDTSKISDGTEGQFTYLWNFGDQNANAANPNKSTLKNPQHKYTATGNYNVNLTVTSVNGCSSSVTQVFTINGTTPQSNFSIQGGNQHCSNNSVTVRNNSTVDFGGIVKMEIFWDYAGDQSNKTLVQSPPAGGTYSYTYPEFYSPATKDYIIRVVAYSGDNCFSSTTQTLTMKATPQVVFSTISPVCSDVPAFPLTQGSVSNSLPGTGVYTGTGVTSGNFDPSVAGAGSHIIRYTFTSTNGCINYKEQTVVVYPKPTANAGPDRFMLEGGSTVLVGAGTGSNLTYVWTPAAGLNNSNVAQPTANPNEDTKYTLTVITSDGCKASDEVVVKVLKGPTIPNVFSPNGDGINDNWDILYLDTYPGATVQIYNRYGQKIFESKGYTKPWDGSLNGRKLPAGTYYYVVDPKNGRKPMSGFVDIIR